MTYEKHITDLMELAAEQEGSYSAALSAAIDLMRAAEPKDAAAERDYCTREWSRVLKDKVESAVQWLMNQRAAVRAKTAVEIACLRKDVEDWKRCAQRASEEAATWAGKAVAADAQRSSWQRDAVKLCGLVGEIRGAFERFDETP